MKLPSLTVLILTYNEERHIRRCIESVDGFATNIVVVDSGSSDATVEIAQSLGAKVLYNSWVNYSTQLNWGLEQLPSGSDWVMRLDADETVSSDLSQEILEELPNLRCDIDGVYVSRWMNFLGSRMRWGGVFPIRVLRLFRFKSGRCENRWMDEHILVDGLTAEFKGEIIDDNLNSLSWWTEKHNHYASREVVDLLNLEFNFLPYDTVACIGSSQQAGVKRWIKENIYARLPGGLRALMYFLYRYVFRLGFIDGRAGAAFHVLQGFWYRYLVDMKLREVKAYMQKHNVNAATAIRDVLELDIAA